MATMKHSRSSGGGITVSWRMLRWVALAIVVALLGVAAWYLPGVRRDAITGASFGARVACSCRYVEGRPLDQCRSDFEPGMEMVSLSEDSAAKSVTARFPLLASQTATYHEGAGCVLEKWEE